MALVPDVLLRQVLTACTRVGLQQPLLALATLNDFTEVRWIMFATPIV